MSDSSTSSNALANIASPARMASGTPYSWWTVFIPLRVSSSSITSSWTRVKLCIISRATPNGTALSGFPPKASQTIVASSGLSRFPPAAG